ncbi:MAG TPA: S8 family serine peptidase, partial [Trueperaceae bacterium]
GALVTDAIISSAIFAVVGPDGVSPLENPGGDSDSAPGAQAYVHIVNMSWGGVAYDQAVNDAMDYMLAHGIVLVTSAGNTPTTGYTEPAWHPGILSVAATRPTGERSAFSNRGRHLSVAAPGVNIWTTATRSCVQQTPDRSSCDPAHPDVNYAYVSGTSFSSPATAGVAALLLDASATRDSDGKITAINLSPAQVRQILEETATQPAGYDPLDLGHGIVDAEAAVKMAMDASQRPPEGATLVVDAVLASDTSVRLPTVSLSLVPNDGGATLYTQTADGSFAALGQGLFQEIDPGDYTLLASGPHTVTTGIEAATFQTDVHLAPGQVATIQAPLDVALFKDPDEPNEDIATAKPLAAGTTQRASLFHPAAASDIDVYRLDVAGGSDYWINVDAVTGDQDMLLEVLADDGAVLASNDDNRETPAGEALPDPALVFSPEADASVYLRLTAKNGDNNPLDLYELDVSELVGAESEPNGSGDNTAGSITNADFTDAESLAVGQALTGAVDPATDVDFVATALEAGTTYVVDLETAVNLEPDTVLVVLASDGSVLASNDDYDAQDSRLAFTVESAGTYYLGVTDFFDPTSQQASTGPYTLSVTTHNNPGAP